MDRTAEPRLISASEGIKREYPFLSSLPFFVGFVGDRSRLDIRHGEVGPDFRDDPFLGIIKSFPGTGDLDDAPLGRGKSENPGITGLRKSRRYLTTDEEPQ